MKPRIGSVCSGYGGLDMAVQEVFGGELAWFYEYEKAPSKVLAHHWPTVPNYGDLTTADWAGIEPVDVMCGGTPCQDLSAAGRRAGMTEGTRSNLWVAFREGIAVQRPSIVVWENVRGAYSAYAVSEVESEPGLLGEFGPDRPALRALGRVLGDLSDLGYDTQWCGVRAADAGAPHGRFRVFILAYAEGFGHKRGRQSWGWWPGLADNGADTVADAVRLGFGEHAGESSAEETWAHASDEFADHHRVQPVTDWGPYAPAINRWEQVLGRVAPAPTGNTGRGGQARLSAPFVEFLMGLPSGWVTSPEIGLSRNDQLKALGNGVVPQQARLALERLTAIEVAA